MEVHCPQTTKSAGEYKRDDCTIGIVSFFDTRFIRMNYYPLFRNSQNIKASSGINNTINILRACVLLCRQEAKCKSFHSQFVINHSFPFQQDKVAGFLSHSNLESFDLYISWYDNNDIKSGSDPGLFSNCGLNNTLSSAGKQNVFRVFIHCVLRKHK